MTAELISARAEIMRFRSTRERYTHKRDYEQRMTPTEHVDSAHSAATIRLATVRDGTRAEVGASGCVVAKVW